MIADRITTRLLGLPQARTAATRREERIPMRDGAVLLAEHHVPSTPTVGVDHVADPPHADLFVRLCDVGPDGRAHNVTDGMRRRDPADGPITIELDPCASTRSRPGTDSPSWSRAARTRASSATTAPASLPPTPSGSLR